MADPVPPTMEEARHHQMYPVLTAAELKRIARFGSKQHFKAGELEKLCSLDFHFKEVNNRFKKLGL